MVAITKFDPLADAWVSRAPELFENSVPGNPEVLLLELGECHRGRVVGLGQLECEDVGLVLLGPAVGHDDGRDGQAGQMEQQDEQGERGNIGKRLEAEHGEKRATSQRPARSTTNRQTRTTRDESRIDRVTWPSA